MMATTWSAQQTEEGRTVDVVVIDQVTTAAASSILALPVR